MSRSSAQEYIDNKPCPPFIFTMEVLRSGGSFKLVAQANTLDEEGELQIAQVSCPLEEGHYNMLTWDALDKAFERLVKTLYKQCEKKGLTPLQIAPLPE